MARSEGDASKDRTATRAGELVFPQRQVNKAYARKVRRRDALKLTKAFII